MTDTCTACHSESVAYLGVLGSLEWFRCRDCGNQYSYETHEENDND